MHPRTLVASALLLLGGLPGCFFLPFDPVDETRAGSPCLDVNLLDGLDEDSSAEMLALYACLNQNGAFDALDPVVDEVVEGSDRNLDPLAMHVAVIFNAVPDKIPIWETLGAVQQLLLEENAFLLQVLQLVAEFVYGVPWPEVAELEEAGQLQDAALLAEGPITHLADYFWNDPLHPAFSPCTRTKWWECEKEHVVSGLRGSLERVHLQSFRGISGVHHEGEEEVGARHASPGWRMRRPYKHTILC